MERIFVPKDDVGYEIDFTINDSDGDAYDLNGYTVTLKMWIKGVSGTLLIDSACSPRVAADGTCYYTILANDFEAVGEYQAELELTQSGIVESTETFEIIVAESG